MPRNRSTAEALRAILQSFALDLHVALPGIVRSYDAANQTAEVELAVQRVLPAADEDQDADTTEVLPILPSVPVAWPRGGPGFVHLPMAAGDSVLVVFSESDMNAWRESGDVSDPGVSTRHGLSGAVAIPGLFPRGNTLDNADATNPRFGHDDGSVYVEVTSGEVRCGGTDQLVRRTELAVHLTAIATALQQIAAAAQAGSGITISNPYVFAAQDASAPIATTVTKGK